VRASTGAVQDSLYERSAAEFGAALARLARGYEADTDKQRDLVQEIHLALWRSFRNFDERCSLRTWVYRVAHNTAISWVVRQKRSRRQSFVSLDDLAAIPGEPDIDRHLNLERLMRLIQRLKPLDRQIILLWLEGMDADEIGDLAGISAANAATKVHRIKALLARQFSTGVSHAE
jgi:RNA polymerase sigma-70 factor (ECF subfamily)